ncbi:hypothetical protein KUTeg_008574 [Tegillarca granosa]|uniref:Sulfotransferase domain-containing protein n=1 Tax=Tegillarca granosa TaxID=220873 RepID=A0ABQ9F9I4_TEGGR|nr:hypothetical protein KUTeg_008574 [Tegillarca granosa]
MKKKSRLDTMAYIANVSYEFIKTDVMGFKMPFKTFDGIDYKFWTFMPFNIEEHLAGLREAEIRDDDVIICTYPRSGTNWTNEIVGMLLNNSAEYIDSILDYMDMIPKEKLAEQLSPRLYISHLPLKYLPEQLAEKGRIICVFRNPKDVAVSFYKFLIKVNFADFTGSFGDFLKLFLNGDLPGGTWFGHVKEWEKDIEEKNAKSILPIYYEDMKQFWTFMPDNIEEHLAGLREADIRDDDVIICTYPRSGTNWTNEIVGMLLNNSANYVDSILDYMDMIPKQKLAEKPSPRLYISHFPLKYLPEQLAEKGRIICVFRNPKDLAVSFYNLLIKVNFADFTGSFGDFLKLFLNGDLPGGTWFGHVKEWEKDIEVNNAKSILPIYYEDMIQDLRGHVEKIAQFLGLPKNDELYDNITRKCTFKNLNAEKKKNVKLVDGETVGNERFKVKIKIHAINTDFTFTMTLAKLI